MKSFIEYYYSIEVDNLRPVSCGYYFDSYDKKYILYKIQDAKQMERIQTNRNKYSKNISFHSIVLTTKKDLFSFDGEGYWILLFINTNYNKAIDFNDIIYFSNQNLIGYSNKPFFWWKLWENKVDYLEYYLNNNDNINSKIRILCIYYLGIAENAISYLKNLMKNTTTPILLSLSHERIKKTYTLFDLYNPINIVEDHISRDISEYIKSFYPNINKNSICRRINNLGLNNIDIKLLISRLLFPSFFFDSLDLIMTDKIKTENILSYYEYTIKYEGFIYEIINDAKKNRNIYVPNILWIKK